MSCYSREAPTDSTTTNLVLGELALDSVLKRSEHSVKSGIHPRYLVFQKQRLQCDQAPMA